MPDATVAELAKALERREYEARVLQQVTRELNSTLDLDRLLELVLRTMDELFGFRHSLVLLAEGTDVLRVVAGRGYEGAGVGAEVQVGTGVIGMVAKKRRIMRVTGLRARRSYVAAVRQRVEAEGLVGAVGAGAPPPGLPDVESQIAIPLVIEDDLIGVFAVESTESNVFSPEDERLVATVANQAASAIQSARLIATLEDKVRTRTAELEATNRELRDTQAQLVQAGKMASLGSLVAGVAHELNTPIASVVSSADTLARGLERLDAAIGRLGPTAQAKDLERIMRAMGSASSVIGIAADRVAHVVRGLRSFARLDEAELQDADLNDAVRQTLALVQHQLEGRIEIETNFAELPLVRCQARRLNQVFLNLIVNAIQAIEGTGTVTVTTALESDEVHVAVEDDGAGIAPEYLDRVFDPGFTTKGVGVGTGLGLSICYRIVHDHAGVIRVSSELGKGSRFTVVIPVGSRV